MSLSYSESDVSLTRDNVSAFNVDLVAAVTDNVTAGLEGPRPLRYPELQNFSKAYVGYHGYIAAVVCVWGIAANLANIVVLTRRHMISSTNTILLWLAVADLLTMVSYFPVSIHFYIMKDPKLDFPTSRSVHWIRFMLFHINFTVLAHTVAIWLTIMLAMWRYLFICYPTRGSQLCSMKNAKIVIAFVYVFSSVICIPNFLSTTHRKNIYPPKPQPNVSSFEYYGVSSSDIVLSNPALEKWNYWIQAFLIKLIPCALLTILTILLIIAMTKANKRRMQLKSQGRKDESERAREHNRTTMMLLAVVGLFLLTEFPQGILTLCNIFIENFVNEVYWPLGDLLDIMALLNNSINFVLYCTMSRQFRDTFVATFCSCCSQHRPGWLKLKTFTVTSNGTTTTTATSDTNGSITKAQQV